MNTDTTAQKARSGGCQSYYVPGNINNLIVRNQITTGQQVYTAQTIENEWGSTGQSSAFIAETQAARRRKQSYFLEGQVYAVGLNLLLNIKQVVHQWRTCL